MWPYSAAAHILRIGCFSALIAFNANGDFMDNLVRRQYENFPYPQVGQPDQGAQWPHLHPVHALIGANHFIYNGKLFDQSDSGRVLRILVAGGGTGRETIAYAQKLEAVGAPGFVVHLDFSLASIESARKWVRHFGVEDRVQFKHSSLDRFLRQHQADSGPLYDVISCMGVLHHLDDPQRSLQMLRQLLAPHGGMHILVYGKHGRTGVYDMQAALRYSLPANELLTNEERIREFRGYVEEAGLPATNMCLRNHVCNPHPNDTDSEILDRLMHAQDRAYSVLELEEYVRLAGMRIVTLVPEATYEPDYTVFVHPNLRDSYMARRIRNRRRLEQFHFVELMTSRPGFHAAWIVPDSVNGSFGVDTMTQTLEGPKVRSRLRREALEWRRQFKPLMVDFGPFSQNRIDIMKKEAFARIPSTTTFDFAMSGKALAKLPMPSLSFAFQAASITGNMTCEQIIRTVHASLAEEHYSRTGYMSSDGDAAGPLTYDEVAEQFFDWFDKMESLGAVFSERVRADEPALSASPRKVPAPGAHEPRLVMEKVL